MKKILVVSGLVASLLLSGCGASNGLGVGGFGQTEVKKVFETGTVESSQKVLISKDMMATLTGAGVGALAGVAIGSRNGSGDAVKGGLIGAGVGAIGGYVGGMMMNNNEQEAYEVELKSTKSGQVVKAYLEKDLPLNSLVEYVVREDGKITNIDVKKIGTPKEIIKEKIVEKEVIKTKIVEKPVIKEVVKTKVVEKPVAKEVAVVPPVAENKTSEKAVEEPKKTEKSVW